MMIKTQSMSTEHDSAISSVTELSHLAEVDHCQGVVPPDVSHPAHQLPLSGEGVELQDVI